jgi:hypothetical protein
MAPRGTRQQRGGSSSSSGEWCCCCHCCRRSVIVSQRFVQPKVSCRRQNNSYKNPRPGCMSTRFHPAAKPINCDATLTPLEAKTNPRMSWNEMTERQLGSGRQGRRWSECRHRGDPAAAPEGQRPRGEDGETVHVRRARTSHFARRAPPRSPRLVHRRDLEPALERAAAAGPTFVFAYNLFCCLIHAPWVVWLLAHRAMT